MSWSSRFGGWAPSRWSPFTSRGDTTNNTVTDKDFSYITAEDLQNHERGERSSHHHHHHSNDRQHRRTSNLQSSRTPRETDLITLRYQRITYPLHFPAYCIDDGEITVGDLREAAGRKLDVDDPRRIRMFYKGRILKDERRTCRDEGLRSDMAADILCVVSDRVRDRTSGGADAGDSDDDEDGDDDDEYEDADGSIPSTPDPGAAPGSGGKKKKRKNRKKKSKRPATASDSGASTPAVEHLPVPTGAHPTHRTASPATPAASSRPQTPQTPRQKLESLAAKFRAELVPQCQAYIDGPPTESAKREFEHKRLTETILAQVLLKLDAVETEGDDEARAQRKALVKEVQGWLNQLDVVVKG